MGLKLLFIKGERGLVSSNNGRFYFPDRNGNIKREGLYDCKITVDKDKYAFVTGQVIQTKMPDAKDLLILMRQSGKDYTNNMRSFKLKRLGNTVLFIENTAISTSANTSVNYVDGENEYGTCTLSSKDRRFYKLEYLPDVNNYPALKKRAIDQIIKVLDADTVLKVAACALCRSSYCNHHKEYKIFLIDQKYIKVTAKSLYNREDSLVYGFADNDVIEITDVADEYFDETAKSEIIDTKSIVDFMAENHISVEGADDEHPITGAFVRFNGEILDLKCLNGKVFLDNISDEDKRAANDSFAELGAYRKQIGKQMTKAMIPEFSKLSPRVILNLVNIK